MEGLWHRGEWGRRQDFILGEMVSIMYRYLLMDAFKNSSRNSRYYQDFINGHAD